MTTQTTLECMPVDCSDQSQPSSQTSQSQAQKMMSSNALKPANHKLEVMSSHTMKPVNCGLNNAIPECYAVNMPCIRACTTSAKQKMGAEDKQGSQQKQGNSGQAGSRLERAEPRKERAGTRARLRNTPSRS